MPLILLDKKNNITTITFNNPDQLNAMDVTMGKEFSKIITHIKNDKSTRVVILTGSGRAFSAGGNLDMLEEKTKKSRATNQRDMMTFYKMFLNIRNLPQPVIASINGAAVGAGFCLSLACDLRLASRDAKFGANFAKLGLAPGMGGTFLITRLAGAQNAAEILMTGKLFTADQALAFGLLNRICEPTELADDVEKLACEIAQNGPMSLKLIKRGIQLAQTKTLEQMFLYDAKAQAQCFATSDIKEGIAAVRQKRVPLFSGK